ncbi:TBCC domain-containing protein 1 [Lates japonicus]|uniref:TBCC domain-containing protein 1 n=1 Tax=Lates japonicus TaxID=270547 RepID=A0AAD3NCI2_LATJO|nr:TBCC domain-containing protein 1 [Lates japonicus]
MATYASGTDCFLPGLVHVEHIACGACFQRLHGSIFETFDLGRPQAEERLEQAECLSQCSSKRAGPTKEQAELGRSGPLVILLPGHLATRFWAAGGARTAVTVWTGLRDYQISWRQSEFGSALGGAPVCGSKAVQPIHRLLAKHSLTLNPFGITRACSGQKLAWAQQVEGAIKRAKIARNTHTAPPGSKMVLMSQVLKQTLAKTSDKLTGANIKIHRCSDAFIYLLSPLRSVSLDKCRDSTVVLGPVETSVHIHSCQNLRVVCVAGRIAVGASSHCTIHALTPTRPLLLPGNTDITMGPFHTFYPSLEDHMASVGLAVVPNAWDQPLLLGTEGLVNPSLNASSNPDPACYRLLAPAEFHTLVVPFQMEGDTCEVPGGLPPPYQAAVDEKQKRIQNWQKTVMEARLNKQQKQQFQELVEVKFHEWLLETGNRQELDSLIPPTIASLKESNGPATDTTRVNDTKHIRNGRAVGQSPMAC